MKLTHEVMVDCCHKLRNMWSNRAAMLEHMTTSQGCDVKIAAEGACYMRDSLHRVETSLRFGTLSRLPVAATKDALRQIHVVADSRNSKRVLAGLSEDMKIRMFTTTSQDGNLWKTASATARDLVQYVRTRLDLEVLRQALQLPSWNIMPHRYLGFALHDLGRYDLAASMYRDALGRCGENRQACLALRDMLPPGNAAYADVLLAIQSKLAGK